MEKSVQQKKQEITNEYDVFIHDYELRYPPPTNNTNKKRWMLRILLGASVVASARHNIPFFLGQVDGSVIDLAIAVIYAIAVVIMVEIALVLLGELIVDDFGDFILMIRPILSVVAIALLLSVAIGSNVTDGFESKGLPIHENIKTFINALANITAPMMALIIGIMYASLDAKFAEMEDLYHRKRSNAWQKHKRDIEIDISVSKPIDGHTDIDDKTPRLSAPPSEQTGTIQTSGSGYTRVSTAVDNARQWLLDNPDKAYWGVRKLADIIPNAGKDSINIARNQLINEKLLPPKGE